TDFGIARILSETTRLTQTGAVMGTPAYMAPEQWNGQPIDARTDIYALGVMMYEVLSGKVPFNAETPFRMMYMHLSETPPPVRTLNPGLPREVEQVLLKALAKDADQRFPSVNEMTEAFREALETLPSNQQTFSLATADRVPPAGDSTET